MSSFPLYDNLNKDIPDEEMPKKQLDKFMKLIKEIDDYGSELIYVLIRMHQKINDETSMYKPPYGGKHDKHDMNFVYKDLPNDLKYILLKFIQIHLKTMREENIIAENRVDNNS